MLDIFKSNNKQNFKNYRVSNVAIKKGWGPNLFLDYKKEKSSDEPENKEWWTISAHLYTFYKSFLNSQKQKPYQNQSEISYFLRLNDLPNSIIFARTWEAKGMCSVLCTFEFSCVRKK